MEKSHSGSKVYKFEGFKTLIQPSVPPLHEIWNWQGDKSVLPSKVI